MFGAGVTTAAAAMVIGLLAADGGPAAAPPARPAARPPSLLTPVIAGKREQAVKYTLRPASGGGYEWDDPRFSAKVERDGRVSFSDHRLSKNWRYLPVMPEPHPPGTPTLERSVRKILGERQRPTEPLPEPRPKHEPVATPEAPQSERDRKYQAEYPMITLVMSTTTLDLTDEYYRWVGEDPYRREKARFLAATFDVRLAMAARAEAADLRTSISELPERLAQIWGDTSQPPAARRRIICALWTELRRDGKGDEAGKVITTFVRTKLAAGSKDAYPPAELNACAAGQASAPRFAPYDPPPTP
jgi:hypothetical protein